MFLNEPVEVDLVVEEVVEFDEKANWSWVDERRGARERRGRWRR